ncbi:MAG: hypothetical protein COA46_10625 [Porticoccaceae bacterium]|nr:MAG: hypothetical protein COA46_10625 [Porticoccaceae bacterium]
MKKIPTKADLRVELQRQMNNYARLGGEIQQIPTGVSGRENPHESLKIPLFNEPKINRTPVPEVIAALDTRRSQKTTKKKPEKSVPQEKIIYDDFGEPLRKVWVDK